MKFKNLIRSEYYKSDEKIYFFTGDSDPTVTHLNARKTPKGSLYIKDDNKVFKMESGNWTQMTTLKE